MTTAYFDQFPMMYYTFDLKTAILSTNFLARVAISDELKSNVVLYDPYTLSDGETPEIVADKVYGDSSLHWVILLTNEIVNPRYDWCLSQEDLLAFVQDKYGSDPAQYYATHHYELPSGLVVDQTAAGSAPVSNYEYEDRLNESKRIIKILNATLVQEFITEFKAAMGT